MSRWSLYFFFYSLAGCALEKVFARAVRSRRQVRKCFLLLPLCPVYGLAMAAVLALPEEEHFLLLALRGGAVCTGVEYLVHLFYARALGVSFWDYRGMPGNLQGRICPQFALAWGLLSAAAVKWLQPGVDLLAARTPRWAVFALWLVLAADSVCTAALLRRSGDVDLLSLTALLAGPSPGGRIGPRPSEERD